MPRRRVSRLYPVPSIPAGSWRAAGNRFLVPLRRPRQERMESFTQVRTVQIGGNGIAGGVMSGSGTSTVTVGPSGYGTRWYPNQVNIATQTGAADASTCTFYLNVVGSGGFLGQSYAGGGDQVGLALPEMQPGDLLYAVWSGGHSGDWTQVTVIGNQDVLVP
jgi:hypothetical protein